MTSRTLVLAAVGALASVGACGGGDEATPATTTAAATTIAPTTTAAAQPGVVVERDVAFATYGDTTLTLDLYIPADPVGAPIVIEPWERFVDDVAEDGAFAVLIKENVPAEEPEDSDDPAAIFWTDHGALIRAEAEQYACAIRFARARASEHGSDDPIVVLGGFSHHGGIAAHVALFGATLDASWNEFAATVGGPPRQVECAVPEGSTQVDALVDGAGTYDLYVPVIEGLYGRSYLQERDPELQQFLAGAVGAHPGLTVRLLHGTSDQAIPMQVSEDFEAALAAAGYDVTLTTYAGGHSDPPVEISREIFTEVLGL